jgi:hypothetical protein
MLVENSVLLFYFYKLNIQIMKRLIYTLLTFLIFNYSFSQLRSADCSRTNTSLTQLMYASISGASQYKFKIHNLTTGITDSLTTTNRYFKFIDIPSVGKYNCSYDVRVAMNYGAGFGPYSSPCFPTTAPLIMTLRAVDCGKILLAMNSPVWASGEFADSWDFEIRLGLNHAITQLFTGRPTREFRVTQAGAQFQTYNTEIQIRVRSTQGGVLQPWGAWCSIFTPNLTPPEIIVGCNTTFEYLAYEYITCTPMDGATQYNWKLRLGSTVVDFQTTSTNQIRISDFLTDLGEPAYDYNRTYNISVQALNGALWSNFGPTCNVSTTSFPHAEVQHLCGQTLTSFSTPISVFAIFHATSYQYEVTDMTLGPENDGVQYYTSAIRNFTLSNLTNWSYGHEYSVRCRVVFKSILHPYGTSCSVFAPPPLARLRPQDCPKTLLTKSSKVYSNPMTSDFPISTTGYQFRIGAQESAWKATRDITLQEILGSVPANNTTYGVEVRIIYEGIIQPYGAPCAITTPIALIQVDNIEEVGDETKQALLIDIDSYNFNVFPNPSNENFIINFSDEMENQNVKIEIYDFSGRLLMNFDEKDISNSSLVFGDKLEMGNYFLRISSGGIVENKTIIKL